MLKLYDKIVDWLQDRPVMVMEETLPNAVTLAMRLAESMAKKGAAVTLIRETGNPDFPQEVLRYNH